MESGLEYLFGIGDGHTTTWLSAPDADVDGDGHTDAVTLDFDGDGHRDDAMWDVDGDGVAEVAALDLDDDGHADHWYRDNGSGVWGEQVARPAAGHGTEPGRLPDHAPPVAGPRPVPPADAGQRTSEPETSEPGTDDSVRVGYDTDHDGTRDIEIVGTRRAGIPVAQRLYIDSDGDGTFDRVLVDTDADGTADVTFDAHSPRFGRR